MKTGENIDYLLNEIYKAVNPESINNNLLPMNQVDKYTFKDFTKKNCKGISLILVGNTIVGKTCFIQRYVKNEFGSDHIINTTAISNEFIKLRIKGEDLYILTIWDTLGQERFKCLPKNYYKNVDGVLLLFDVNNKTSFEDGSNWMGTIKENAINKNGSENNKIVIYL